MSVQRQTYIVLGILVLGGLALGLWHSQWWFVLPALGGLGMTVAGLIGVCTLNKVLSRLPWNEPDSGKI
jgi:hypothetical protein